MMDIREVLNTYSAKEVKDIVRKHNLHYKIKLTGKTKADYINALSALYKSVKGHYLMPFDHPLVIKKLGNKDKLPIIKKSYEPIPEPIIIEHEREDMPYDEYLYEQQRNILNKLREEINAIPKRKIIKRKA